MKSRNFIADAADHVAGSSRKSHLQIYMGRHPCAPKSLRVKPLRLIDSQTPQVLRSYAQFPANLADHRTSPCALMIART
jgi:hypothetical protein